MRRSYEKEKDTFSDKIKKSSLVNLSAKNVEIQSQSGFALLSVFGWKTNVRIVKNMSFSEKLF